MRPSRCSAARILTSIASSPRVFRAGMRYVLRSAPTERSFKMRSFLYRFNQLPHPERSAKCAVEGRTMTGDISYRPMREADLAAADRVFRLSFGTWFGLADPMQFRGGEPGLFEPRFWSYPDGGTLAVRDGEM